MKNLRIILMALVLLALGTSTPIQRGLSQQSGETRQTPKPGDPFDYTPEPDISGARVVAKHLHLPAERNLQTPCLVKQQAIKDAYAEAEASIKALENGTSEVNWPELARVHDDAGEVSINTGDIKKAISEFEAAYQIELAHQDTNPELAQKAIDELVTLGVAQLRRGELENCALNHNAEMCILPLSVTAQHKLPSGSELAIQYFEKYLSHNPISLEIRWLLNIAYMTLGKYPDKVPPEYLIPMPSASPKEGLTRFPDVGADVGIDRVGNAGGSIVDDFDNDGLLDIAISNVDPCTRLQLYHNDGNGRFSDWSDKSKISEQPGAINMIQTDYNNDGILDIFVLRGGWEFPMRNSLLRGNRDGTFTDVTIQSGLGSTDNQSHSAAWADYDNDGWLDLFVGHETTPSQLFHNRGDGTFEDVSSKAHVDLIAYTKGVTWGDYDNDGYPDLYVSNYRDQNFLFHNKGDGTFDEVATELHVDKPLWSFPTWFWDYDNDGWLDIFVASYTFSIRDVVRGFMGQPPLGETMKLYHNTGKGSFEDVTKAVGLDRVVPAMGANFGDLDGDGYLDFYLGTGSPSYAALVPNFMFKNVGGKSFVDVTGATGTGHLQKGHGVAFSDINNDGAQDVFANIGGAVPSDKYNKSLFLNPGIKNNWISVKLSGVKTNRAAILARIKLKLADDPEENPYRYRDVTSGGSFGSSSLTQNIGLGKAKRIEMLEVWWPTSKTRQTFYNVPVNQFIEIKEFATKYTKRTVQSFTIIPGHAHPGMHH